MDNHINPSALSNWATRIYSNNVESINCLTEIKSSLATINNAYECVSSEAIITNINSDIDNAIKTHTGMEKLQSFLEKVRENAENNI